MAPSRAEEPQISTEEMEQIEAFFTQLERGGCAIEDTVRHAPQQTQQSINLLLGRG